MNMLKALRHCLTAERWKSLADAALFTIMAGYPNPYKPANENVKSCQK